MEETRIQLLPSTYETIDFSVYDFINDKMNVSCNTQKGWEKVPVVWEGNERAKQAKDNSTERDSSGTLLYPIISITRSKISKNKESKGKYYANIPRENDYKGGSIVVSRRINQDKTSNFANADSFKSTVGQINFPSSKKNKKIVYNSYIIPQPVYNQIDYTITIITEYEQQMNDIIAPFMSRPGSVYRVMLQRDGHKYEAFINQEFTQKKNTTDFSSEARKFETEINIKVYGYIVSSGNNEDGLYITVRENAVEVKFPRESNIFATNSPLFAKLPKNLPQFPPFNILNDNSDKNIGVIHVQVLPVAVGINTDTLLPLLEAVPISNKHFQLYLNGHLQRQGAGQDYFLSYTNVTWLAGSGTAIDIDHKDEIIVYFISTTT